MRAGYFYDGLDASGVLNLYRADFAVVGYDALYLNIVVLFVHFLLYLERCVKVWRLHKRCAAFGEYRVKVAVVYNDCAVRFGYLIARVNSAYALVAELYSVTLYLCGVGCPLFAAVGIERYRLFLPIGHRSAICFIRHKGLGIARLFTLFKRYAEGDISAL